jgi:hypothetical protein
MAVGHRWSLSALEPALDHHEDLPTTDNLVTVSWLRADAWWQLDPPDMRGYQWRSPGTYVVAADAGGTHIASIQLHFAYLPDGSSIQEKAATALAETFRTLYQDAQ